MPLRVHPRLTLDIGWRDLLFAMTARRSADASLSAIAAAFPDQPMIAALSVRSAFHALLRALAPQPGAEVLMSAVNIENMADIVRAHGLVPIPVDIDLGTLAPRPETVRARITDRTILYLHAHLYGSRNDLAPFTRGCGRVLLVEDCAQAFDGRWRGSPEADVSLFSFGPIKRLTALGGAVARFRDPDLQRRVKAELAGWPEQPDSAVASRAGKLLALKAMSDPAVYGIVLAALKMRGVDPDLAIGAAARGFKSGDLLAQIARRPSPRLLALMARRLSAPPQADWRARCAAGLRADLRADIETPGDKAAAHAHWLFPVLVENPTDIIDALRSEGFDATRGATSMRVIEEGATPEASRLLLGVVYLPLSPRLTPRDTDRMANIVNRLAARPQARAA